MSNYGHVEKGTFNGIEYEVGRVKKNYLVKEIEYKLPNSVLKYSDFYWDMFNSTMGKYEVEYFVGMRLLVDLKVHKCINDLMNMYVMFNDFPYNITELEPDEIRKIILNLFEVISETQDEVHLRFVGRKK